MTEVDGGHRYRLIRDNFFLMLKKGLEDRGAMDVVGAEHPVKLSYEGLDPSKKVEPNSIGLSSEDSDPSDAELGFNTQSILWDFYVDIFAESESVGIYLKGEIMGILMGLFPDIGRKGPVLEVYDLRRTDKPYLFYCDLVDFESARIKESNKSFNRFWWRIACTIEDVQ